MKQLYYYYTVLLLIAGAITCCAQETENWFKRWIKGDLILLTAGYQVPLYGQAGKRFADPLVGYSRQNLVFIPMLSTEIKKDLDWIFALVTCNPVDG